MFQKQQQMNIQFNKCSAGIHYVKGYLYSATCRSLQTTMFLKQKELDQKFGKNIKFQTYQYNIWTISALDGPSNSGFSNNFLTSPALITQYPAQIFIQETKSRYFIKLPKQFWGYIVYASGVENGYFNQNNHINYYPVFIMFDINRLWCPQHHKLKEGSFLHKYFFGLNSTLIKKYNIKFSPMYSDIGLCIPTFSLLIISITVLLTLLGIFLLIIVKLSFKIWKNRINNNEYRNGYQGTSSYETEISGQQYS